MRLYNVYHSTLLKDIRVMVQNHPMNGGSDQTKPDFDLSNKMKPADARLAGLNEGKFVKTK